MLKSYPDRVNEFYKNIPEEVISLWKNTYKDIDIDDQITRAKCWLLNNTNKKKKNFKSFTNNWLNSNRNKYFNIKKVSHGKESDEFKKFKKLWLFNDNRYEELCTKLKERWVQENTLNEFNILSKTNRQFLVEGIKHHIEYYKNPDNFNEIQYIKNSSDYISRGGWRKYMQNTRNDRWYKKQELETIDRRTPEQEEAIKKENKV